MKIYRISHDNLMNIDYRFLAVRAVAVHGEVGVPVAVCVSQGWHRRGEEERQEEKRVRLNQSKRARKKRRLEHPVPMVREWNFGTFKFESRACDFPPGDGRG